MSLRLNRMWLLPFLLLASQAWALGLGEIRLSSALNEPMQAEIVLLAATPEELDNLTIALASAETFDRYDLDRPAFLSRLRFAIVKSGRADGNIVRITSSEPISEPFVTFLVEASWSRGRLLREYTILLDPPTFAPPPATQSTQAVTAPSRAAPADSGRIERQAPPPQQQPSAAATQPVQAPTQTAPAQSAPRPAAAQDQAQFDGTPGGDLVVQRGDTLWGITSRVRPDSRLTMNQTMLAIYQANPQAFAGNINVLRAGATLRIPSADDVFRISRGDALSEIQRQNAEWSGSTPSVAPDIPPITQQPSLTLVPPDEEDDIGLTDETIGTGATDDTLVDDAVDPVADRISEIENILSDQNALISIPDNELAALRNELAELRGEEPPVPDVVDDELLVDDGTGETVVDDEILVDDETAPVDDVQTAPPPVVTTATTPEEGIVDKLLGYANNLWVLLGVVFVAVIGILFWFMRRAASRDDEDVTGVWDALDSDEMDDDSVASTERLRALAREDKDSIVVVETGQGPGGGDDEFGADTTETPVMPATGALSTGADTGINKKLEDTFSSETAINLDQSDPIAEADFHMAYGLYDQAADLINGALTADPERQDLLAKLCEIYFVWGNRDAFIDAAGRLRSAVGGGGNPDWDKTVIMGQQIAGDHELFSGVSAEGATKAVDLSFDGGSDESAGLDIDFAGDSDTGDSDIIDLGGIDDDDDMIDLGADTGQVSISPDMNRDIDFNVEDEPDIEASITREMPNRPGEAPDDSSIETVETPTIEQQFELEATGELPSLTESDFPTQESDATAEINLDDLGLDIGDLGETTVDSDIADDDHLGDLDDTAESQGLDIDDSLIATGRNEAIVPDDSLEATGRNLALGDDEATQLASLDDDDGEDTDVGIDTSLLDATGQTQILTEDMAVDTSTGINPQVIADDEKTMLAPLDDDDDDSDFDFAKTEALPKDAFSSDMSTDETGRMPGLAGSTDMDLDLDDLTAALKVSEVGDTVNQTRDEATVEQPRIRPGGGGDSSETSITQALTPEDLSGDLHEARTMTEVGTKLDLARAYVDMGDPSGARSILEEVLDEGDEGQKQQAQQLLDSLPT